MKIAHITTSLINGGSEAAMNRLIRASVENTHFVISLTGTGHYQSVLEETGVKVYCLQFKGVGVPLGPLLALRRILKAEKPDVVQTWMYHANFFGGLAARSLGIRSVLWNLRTSNPQLGNFGRATQWLNIVLARLAYVVPQAIISCAHRATSAHVAMGYPERKIITICNGYDMSYLCFSQNNRDRFRSHWHVPADTLLIGMVARWHPQKDHLLLFRALEKIGPSLSQPWRLILVGTDMTAENEELLQQLKDTNILEDSILVGALGEIPTVMSALDLHILTSTDEGFPNVIAEAMACQTPCLSTNAGDAEFIIGDAGWVGPVGDVDALSVNLQKAFAAYAAKDVWDALLQRARQRIASEFNIETMTRHYQEIWQQAKGRIN